MALKDDHMQKAKRKSGEQKQEGAAKRVKANSGAKSEKQSAPQAVDKANVGPASGKQQEKQQKHRSKTIQDAIMKWETLRRHDISTKQREELISTLLQELKGKLAGMAASPSGSRILQACVKHGSPEQRGQTLEELQPSFLELSKSPYAHFLVCKLIDTAPKSAIEGFMKTFKGQVVKLLRHPCGSRVINELYTRAFGKQRKLLAAEFYGREMVIFSQDAAPKTLAECLGSMDDTGKHRVVQQMSINLIPVLEKGLLDPILVHGLVAEYMEAAPPTAVADVVEMLAGPPLLHMVHSRPGATAACQVLAMATAKQRKKVIKAMKGHVKVMATDEWAHVVLMAALEHTDDTALLRKSLVPELLADLGDLCQHKIACNIFLHLLAPSNRAYLPPHVSALLAPRPAVATSTKSAPEASAEASDVLEEEVPSTVAAPVSSKKDAVLRRQELLSSGKGSLAAELTSVCATTATKLLRNPRACDLLVEAACGSEGGLLADACPEGVAAVQDAIVAATGQASGTSDNGLTEAVMENFFGSRALKKLIGRGQGSDRAASEARKVAAKLWESSMKGKCKALSSSHAAKVLAAVFLFADDETREDVKRELLTVMEGEASIESWANRALGAQADAKQKPEQQQRKKRKK